MVRLGNQWLVCGLLAAFLIGVLSTDGFTDNIKDSPTDYMIIVTGGELLRGVYADGHAYFITRILSPLGCRCIGTMCVGDKYEDLYNALEYASQKTDFIIVTGGLGPTDDDITRKSLSEFTKISLKENPEAVKAMMRRFNVDDVSKIRQNLRIQTHTPVKGTYLPNPNGTAVGLVYDDGQRVIASLPGPPRELQPMVKNHLIPFLAKRFGVHSIGCSITMRFVGIGESNIDHTMHQRMTLPENLMISSLFEFGRVDLTFSLPGDAEEDKNRLKSLENELLSHINDYFYADDGSSLEECVLGLFKKKGVRFTTAEVGSGGSLAACLNYSKGVNHVYKGGYIAPSNKSMAHVLGMSLEVKDDDALSKKDETECIARWLCKDSSKLWSLAVSEIIEEDDSRFVWIAFGSKEDGFEVKRASMRGHGETGQARLVNKALDLLRRRLR